MKDAEKSKEQLLDEITSLRQQLQHEKYLKQQEQERYHLLFNMANDFIFMHYLLPDGESSKFVEVNDTACSKLGYSKEELLQLSPREITNLGFSEENREQLKKNSELLFDIDLVTKKGNLIPVEIHARLYYYNQQAMIISVARDITKRKQTEVALKESEERFRLLFESSSHPILVLDHNLRFLMLNSVAAKNLSATPEEVIGKLLQQFLPEFQETTKRRQERVFATGKSIRVIDVVNLTYGQRWFYSTIDPLRNSLGEIYAIQIISYDITEQKEAEERLRQAQKMEAIGQLAGGIAHDFNNQLQGIMGYAELLCDDLQKGELREYAMMILRSAERSAGLTRQLLAFARKGKNLSLPVDIHKIIDEVISILKHTIDKKITIQKQLEASPCCVLGDPSQIQNALLNLGINARDALPEGGTISFFTDIILLDEEFCRIYSSHGFQPGRYLQICVKDTGVGMDQEVQKRIFEPFFTTKEEGQGTGMGLAAVYGIVKNHFGAIHVKSTVHQGTEFTIYFPFVEDHYEKMEENTQQQQNNNYHILLIDDEEALQSIISSVLQRFGYTTKTTKNGEDAISYYRENYQMVDLVILDMVMPEMNGRELFAILKQINPQVKVLFASGYSEESQLVAAEGASGFIQKPFCMSVLSEKIQTILSSSD